MSDESTPPVNGPEEVTPPPAREMPAPPPPAMTPPPEEPPLAREAPPQSFQSNYPRAMSLFNQFARAPGVYFDSIGTAWNMLVAQWQTYLVGSLILGIAAGIVYFFVVAVAIGGTLASGARGGQPSPWLMILPSLLLQVVLGLGYLCMISMGVGHLQTGFAKLADFAKPFRRPNVLATSLGLFLLPNVLMLVPNAILQFQIQAMNFGHSPNAILLILSGFVVFVGVVLALFFTPNVLLASTSALSAGKAPLDSLKTLFSRIGWGGIFMMGLLYLVSAMIGGIGLFACLIGALFTMPIMTNVLALHYVYCFPDEQPSMTQEGGAYTG